MSGTWERRLQDEITGIPTRVQRAKKFYTQNKEHLHKYHGGMPVGFMAAIGQWESGGKMSSKGDESLGEYGYYQITDSFPKKVGVNPEVRKTAEGNIFLAGLEYNITAKRLSLLYPGLIREGSQDQWMLARLSFAIGMRATRSLIDSAKPIVPGRVYKDILNYVNTKGTSGFGTQSAEKVTFRVNAIPIQWKIGQGTVPDPPGSPVKVPSMVGIAYALPSGLEGKLKEPGGTFMATLVTAGIILAAI